MKCCAELRRTLSVVARPPRICTCRRYGEQLGPAPSLDFLGSLLLAAWPLAACTLYSATSNPATCTTAPLLHHLCSLQPCSQPCSLACTTAPLDPAALQFCSLYPNPCSPQPGTRSIDATEVRLHQTRLKDSLIRCGSHTRQQSPLVDLTMRSEPQWRPASGHHRLTKLADHGTHRHASHFYHTSTAFKSQEKSENP